MGKRGLNLTLGKKSNTNHQIEERARRIRERSVEQAIREDDERGGEQSGAKRGI